MNEIRLMGIATEFFEAKFITRLYQATQQLLWIGWSASTLARGIARQTGGVR